MFLDQKNNAIYRVSLTLERVLYPFWNLFRSLQNDALLTSRDYSQFNADFQNDKQARIERCDADYQRQCDEINSKDISQEQKDEEIAAELENKYDTVFSEAFNHVNEYYLGKLLSHESFKKGIKESCSLIVYKHDGECRFVTEGTAGDGFGKELRNCLASLQIVDQWIGFLNGGNTMDFGFNPKIYASVLPERYKDDVVSIASPLYAKDNIVAKERVIRQKTDYQVWYNESLLRKLGYDNLDYGEVFGYLDGENLVGIECGQYFIPLVTNWQNSFTISDKSQIVWTDFKNNIFNSKEKSGDVAKKPAKQNMSSDEKTFVEAATSDDFTNLLSHLTDNLFLPDNAPAIKAEYQKFFHPLMKVEELKHLVDYKLYVPIQEQGTVLGVYKIHKLQGETEYNLRHMLYARKSGENPVIKDYNNDEHRSATVVQVLQPQYASFYMMDYYEFFFEAALEDLKSRNVIQGYLRNQHYTYKTPSGNKLCEIDAVVYAGGKIFFFELKTTLHIEFLNTYPQKYAAMLQHEESPELYEFYLVSSFAEDNISILKPEPKDGYNERRAGLMSIPYKFDVAIPIIDGAERKDLHCLSESSFEKLKAELQRVFTA